MKPVAPNLVLMGVEVAPRLDMTPGGDLVVWIEPVYESMPGVSVSLGTATTRKVIRDWAASMQEHRRSTAPIQPRNLKFEVPE